jgi:hypothetical protein
LFFDANTHNYTEATNLTASFENNKWTVVANYSTTKGKSVLGCYYFVVKQAVPAQVQTPTVNNVAETSLDVHWTKPARVPTSYTVKTVVGGSQSWNVNAPATTLHITGLMPSTGYRFTVVAINAIGSSIVSNPSALVTTLDPIVPSSSTGVIESSSTAEADVSSSSTGQAVESSSTAAPEASSSSTASDPESSSTAADPTAESSSSGPEEASSSSTADNTPVACSVETVATNFQALYAACVCTSPGLNCMVAAKQCTPTAACEQAVTNLLNCRSSASYQNRAAFYEAYDNIVDECAGSNSATSIAGNSFALVTAIALSVIAAQL